MKKKCVHALQPKRGPIPNKHGRQNREFKFKDVAAREKALMRHSWYRKKKLLEQKEAK